MPLAEAEALLERQVPSSTSPRNRSGSRLASPQPASQQPDRPQQPDAPQQRAQPRPPQRQERRPHPAKVLPASGRVEQAPKEPPVEPQPGNERGVYWSLDDPAADRAALQELARRLEIYSPLVGLEEQSRPESLLLEITGCSEHFGGEAGLLNQLVADLQSQGWYVRAAVAATVGAAWALAHCGRLPRSQSTAAETTGSAGEKRPLPLGGGGWVAAPESAEDWVAWLAALPVTALRLSPANLSRLEQLELRRVGQILQLPRETLPSRFGEELLTRLDQAMGRQAETILPETAPRVWLVRREFEYPLSQRAVIEVVVCELLQELLVALQTQGYGVTRLQVQFRQQPAASAAVIQRDPLPSAPDEAPGSLASSAASTEATATTAAGAAEGTCPPVDPARMEWTLGLIRPTAAAAHLRELFRLQIERAPFQGEVSEITIQAESWSRLGERQDRLWDLDPAATGERERQRCVERLIQRLGPEHVCRAEAQASHVPEQSSVWRPWVDHTTPATKATSGASVTQPTGSTRKVSRPRSQPPQGPTDQHAASDGAANPTGLSGPWPCWQSEPAAAAATNWQPGGHSCWLRPTRLFAEPQPLDVMGWGEPGPPPRFRWGQQIVEIVRSWGPERIETGWWAGDLRRDYYWVETRQAARLWIYFDGVQSSWWIHG